MISPAAGYRIVGLKITTHKGGTEKHTGGGTEKRTFQNPDRHTHRVTFWLFNIDYKIYGSIYPPIAIQNFLKSGVALLDTKLMKIF